MHPFARHAELLRAIAADDVDDHVVADGPEQAGARVFGGGDRLTIDGHDPIARLDAGTLGFAPLRDRDDDNSGRGAPFSSSETATPPVAVESTTASLSGSGAIEIRTPRVARPAVARTLARPRPTSGAYASSTTSPSRRSSILNSPLRPVTATPCGSLPVGR